MMEYSIGTSSRKLNKLVSFCFIFVIIISENNEILTGPEISVDMNNENPTTGGDGAGAVPQGDSGAAASNKASMPSAGGNAAAAVPAASSGVSGIKGDEGVSGRDEGDNKEGGQRRSIISSIW